MAKDVMRRGGAARPRPIDAARGGRERVDTSACRLLVPFAGGRACQGRSPAGGGGRVSGEGDGIPLDSQAPVSLCF